MEKKVIRTVSLSKANDDKILEYAKKDKNRSFSRTVDILVEEAIARREVRKQPLTPNEAFPKTDQP